MKNDLSGILDKPGTRDRTRAALKAITLRITWALGAAAWAAGIRAGRSTSR